MEATQTITRQLSTLRPASYRVGSSAANADEAPAIFKLEGMVPVSKVDDDTAETLARIVKQANEPPHAALQTADSRSFAEFWKNGTLVAKISESGSMMTPNAVDVTEVLRHDGSATGKTLAASRTQWLAQTLGPSYELRQPAAPTSTGKAQRQIEMDGLEGAASRTRLLAQLYGA